MKSHWTESGLNHQIFYVGMLKVGTLVRVRYPDYAAGIQGYLEAQEEAGRWIVRLEKNPLEEDSEPLLLSLKESEFEVLKP